MCGIVGAIARRSVPAILIEGLLRLEYRGYDSAGLAVIGSDDARLHRRRVLGKVRGLTDSLAAAPLSGNVGIAHTRWATHGAPSERNAHPHASSNDLMLVHNGIIENHADLRRRLQAEDGVEFTSDTDTEVIVHLIARERARSGSLVEAVHAALQQLEGAYAIGVICQHEPDKLVCARQGSPLVLGVGIGENFIASDVLALRPVTDRFIFLEEGDLAEVHLDNYTIWDAAGNRVERPVVKIDLGVEDLEKGNYRHYMLKEIHEQPRVVRATLEGRLGKRRILEEAFGVRTGEVLDRVDNVTIVACGTSYYAGCVARYWIEEIAGIPCQVEIASEFRYRRFATPPRSLFVTISQSGETADTLAALRLAKQSGYEGTLAICNVPTSSLVRESEISFMLNAGAEIGVASTKAFTAQLVVLFLLTMLLGRRRGMDEEREAQLVAGLNELPTILERTLRLDDQIRTLSQRFIDKRHALFLGRGKQYPIALEGALKLKEISYIHAEGYPAGELKHGPLALVDSDMPVVAIAPGDDLVEKLQSNLEEVRARGGQLFVFADERSSMISDPGMTVMAIPAVDEVFSPIVYTLPLQLLAYHAAVFKGTDVDQPRNLAKSVTVE